MTLHVKDKVEEAPAAFTLNAQSSSFASRSNDIFANLGTLEKKHSAFVKAQESTPDSSLEKNDPCDDDVSDGSNKFQISCRDAGSTKESVQSRYRLGDTRDQDVDRHSRHSSSNNRGTGFKGGFRAPNRLPPRIKGVPDFKKHPERWTCYSLDDVPNSDMSDKSTKNAALEFLEGRRRDRERQERIDAGLPEEEEEEKFDINSGACSQGTIVFKRKKKSNEEDESSEVQGKSSSSTAIKPDLENSLNVCEEQYDENEKTESVAVESSEKPGVFKFKAKKSVKRSIRKKDSDSDSDT